MSIAFESPGFLLLIPVVIVLLIISMRFMVIHNKRAGIGQIIVRSILAISLILALAQISFKWTGKEVTTIFLVDVSDSVKEQRDETIRFVNEAVKTKARKDSVAIIAFGKDPRVEQYIAKEVSFSEFQTDVSKEATDLEEAVKIALAQLPEDSAKRIVLISDGNENEGDLQKTAASVVASGCDFQVYKLSENDASEVYVSDIKVPKEVGVGENFNINVEVESNVACEAVVSLYSGRTLKGQQSVSLQKGTNRFVFKDTQTDEGLKTYRVTVDATADTVTVNNEFSAFTSIEIDLPILVVEGEPGKAAELQGILDSMGENYEVILPSTVPNTMSDFMEYSSIIFVDVYAEDLRDGFMEQLEDYVKVYGGGFVATGGRNSFALGGYRDTPIEKVLPVYMDLQGENEIPVMAMQVVLDQSGSMSDGNGFLTNLDLAKESANAAVTNVRETDYIGVMAFDDYYDRVVPLQLATDKEAISNSVFSIGLGGGTSIYPALLAATEDVVNCNAMIKHILLLTDGQDGTDLTDYEDLIETINAAGITLSTVAVGTGCNSELLEDLAEACGGRYYYTDINSNIPRIFAQEVYLSSNTYLVNEEFTPIITANDEMISDVAVNGLPNLYGYVATTPKERCIEVLQSPAGDPILAYWQYGLGKTVAWTSDVTGQWSSAYSGWENTPLLWHNIIEYLSADTSMDGSYSEVIQNGSTAELRYVTESYDANTSVWATVYDDTGKSYEIELEPVKPGEYRTEIETNATGIYTINLRQMGEGDEIVSSLNTAAIMQYSMEYRFYPNNTLLDEYVAAVGGVMIDDPAMVFAEEPEFVKTRWNLTIPLLIFAAFFFLIDIAVRRFHLDWTKVFAGGNGKAKKEKVSKASKKTKPEEVKTEVQEEIIERPFAIKERRFERSQSAPDVTAATSVKTGPMQGTGVQSPVNRPFANAGQAQRTAGTGGQASMNRTSANAGNAATPGQKPVQGRTGTEPAVPKQNQVRTRVWTRDGSQAQAGAQRRGPGMPTQQGPTGAPVQGQRPVGNGQVPPQKQPPKGRNAQLDVNSLLRATEERDK